jgi:hypothetical protein
VEVEGSPRSNLEAVRDTGAASDPDTGPARHETAEAAGDAEALHERCAHHPGRPAVARCEACDEPICLICAVPVRGRVLGPGCVAEELGDPGLVDPPEEEPGRAWGAVAGAAIAAIGTAGPWTRAGASDRAFGAWVPDVRWSTVAAVAAIALIPAAWWATTSATARRLAGALGAVVVVASVLAIVFPPPFQAASWGPWVTAAGGVIATAAAAVAARAERRRTQGV